MGEFEMRFLPSFGFLRESLWLHRNFYNFNNFSGFLKKAAVSFNPILAKCRIYIVDNGTTSTIKKESGNRMKWKP